MDESPIEVELDYGQVATLVRRYMFHILNRSLAARPWRVTRMGPRGVEVTLIDNAFMEATKERIVKRMKKRLTP